MGRLTPIAPPRVMILEDGHTFKPLSVAEHCAYCGNRREGQRRCDGCGAARWIVGTTTGLIEVMTMSDPKPVFVPAFDVTAS
jgi:hypothetical protein